MNGPASVSKSERHLSHLAAPGSLSAPRRVLLLVSNDHGSNIPVMWCLGSRGSRVWILGPVHDPAIGASRYCEECFTCAREDLLSAAPDLISRVNDLCERLRIDVIVPAGIESGIFLSRARAKITKAAVFPVPEAEQISLLNNKWRFSRHLATLCLPTPRTWLVNRPEDMDGIPEYSPVLVKPLEAAGGTGISVCRSARELREDLQQRLAAVALPCVVQEYVAGSDVAFAVLAEQGTIRAWTLQRERDDGLSVEFFRDEAILDMGRRIVDALNLTGVVEFDLRFDVSTGRVYLLECNPRFWQSVAISMASGVDFVGLGLRMAGGESLPPTDATGAVHLRLARSPRRRFRTTGLLAALTRPSIRGLRLAAADPLPLIRRYAGRIRRLIPRQLRWTFNLVRGAPALFRGDEARNIYLWKLNGALRGPLYALGRTWRRTLARRTRVVAVVGSYGKTTTTRATAAVLGLPDRRWRDLNGNLNALVPLALLRHFPPGRFAVVEAGLGPSRQMAVYARVLQPAITVVTAVGAEHIQAFGSLEAIRDEKARMVEALPLTGIAVLNGDDPRVMAMAAHTRARIVTFGLGEANDVRATDLALDWPHGTRLILHLQGESFAARTSLIGRYMIYPFLAAAAVGMAAGVESREIIRRLERVPPTPGRLQPVPLPGGAFALRDDYKSTVETIHASLDTLETLPARRRIVVLGDIDAPPPPERPHYREVGRRVAAIADHALFVGQKFGLYRAGLRAGGMAEERFRRVGGVHEAAAALREMIRPGDVVLVKGREGQRLTRIILALNGRNVQCSVDPCRLHLTFCEHCPLLERASEAATIGDHRPTTTPTRGSRDNLGRQSVSPLCLPVTPNTSEGCSLVRTQTTERLSSQPCHGGFDRGKRPRG